MHLTWLAAFGAGLGSLLSPCVVPLIPSYLTAMSGSPLDGTEVTQAVRARVMANALAFCGGFTMVLVLSGMWATRLGLFLHRHETAIAHVGGVVVVLFGLELLGAFTLPGLKREARLFPLTGSRGRVASTFAMGIAFAAGWTPCIGPVWSAILLMASTRHSMWTGGALLLVYALGMAAPFLLLALGLGQATTRLRSWRRYVPCVERATGVLMLALGVSLATGFYGAIPGLL